MTPAVSAPALDRKTVDIFGRSWEGRRVTVVGLGRSGVAAAGLLCRIGARVRVTDRRDTEQIRSMRAEVFRSGVEEVELGVHSERMVEGSEMLVASPGVPDSAEPVQWALEQGIPVISEIELAFHFCRSPLVAVTGTNGKSTAVTLIAEVLKAAGRPAVACGNLGRPFTSVIPTLTPQTTVVVEVSSFQLLWCDHFRPSIGVFLNIGTNHLDRHQDAAAYLAAKARLFARQTRDDWAVLNGGDASITALGATLPSRCVWFGRTRSNPPEFHLGPMTQRALTENAQAVLQVARVLGVPDPMTWQAIRSFRGLEHRLERVAAIRGVHFVNDSKSTTPDSTLYALRQTPGEIVVILGGRDKGLDFHPLAKRLHEARVSGIVLMGESRSRLRSLLNGSTVVKEGRSLQDAITVAATLAGPGSTVLFSPACASFDMFRDFEERGRAFKQMVSRLSKTRRTARTR